MISHGMGYLLKDILMIGVIGKIMMSCSEDFCCLDLMIEIVIKSSSL